MNVEINNRWNELEPEVQLSLVRLINELASMGSAKVNTQVRRIKWECSNDGELGQTVNLVALPE